MKAIPTGAQGQPAAGNVELKHMAMDWRQASLLALIAALAFAGHAHATEASYQCSDGTRLTAKFSPPGAKTGRVTLAFNSGRKLRLPQAMSADGGRYVGGGIEFWIKGRNATLTRNGKSETCATQ